jgi:hypothetical protein
MARQCAFCGSTENITREHVWPKWASEHVSKEDTFTAFRHFAGEGFEPEEPHSRGQRPFDWTVNAVCESCNNGWMATLESSAKAGLFSSAFEGRGRALHHGGQRTLAAWALKTAMMVEHTNTQVKRGIPRAEYLHLYEHGEPSERVRVWLGSYVGEAVAGGVPFGKDLDMDAGPDRERGERDVWGATILFGPVVFQVIGTRLPGLLGVLDMATPNTNQIWPYRRSCTWTPQPAMDDVTLLGLPEGYLSWLDTLSARQQQRGSSAGPGV